MKINTDIFDFISKFILGDILIEGFPITYRQYLILELLAEKKRCLITQLSKELNVAISTVTEIVDKLMEKNMVKKEKDEIDRRKVWVFLTNKGEKILNKVKERKETILQEISKILTPNEREVFEKVLHKISLIKEKINV